VKRAFFAVLIAFSIIGTGFSVHAEDVQAPSAQMIAYYFHGDARCPTCHKLERYSKEAIENNFKDEIASGKLVFKEVNVDQKGNEHFVDDYQLYTKSLVLSLTKDGREIRSKNLPKIWEYAGNKQQFFDYVTGEISDFLKD